MRSKLTLNPVAYSRSGPRYKTGPIIHYRVEFDPPLPGYVADIFKFSADDQAPLWQFRLSRDGVQQDYPVYYESAEEALTVLQKEFEH